MKDLAEIFREAGRVDVRIYIQSGNVVFQAEDALAERIPGLVTVGKLLELARGG